MPKNKYTEKQMKIARVAEPRDKITGEDFEELRKADGGMVKFDEGGDVRREMLMQKLEDLDPMDDDDAEEIKIIKAELFQTEFATGGRVKGFRSGMSVKADGMARGCGAVVRGGNFSGTY